MAFCFSWAMTSPILASCSSESSRGFASFSCRLCSFNSARGVETRRARFSLCCAARSWASFAAMYEGSWRERKMEYLFLNSSMTDGGIGGWSK
jgi:hypothetical protein